MYSAYDIFCCFDKMETKIHEFSVEIRWNMEYSDTEFTYHKVKAINKEIAMAMALLVIFGNTEDALEAVRSVDAYE